MATIWQSGSNYAFLRKMHSFCTLFFLHFLMVFNKDHLGSSTLITNDSGNVVQRIEYLPYGEVFLGQKNIPVISKINGTIF